MIDEAAFQAALAQAQSACQSRNPVVSSAGNELLAGSPDEQIVIVWVEDREQVTLDVGDTVFCLRDVTQIILDPLYGVFRKHLAAIDALVGALLHDTSAEDVQPPRRQSRRNSGD